MLLSLDLGSLRDCPGVLDFQSHPFFPGIKIVKNGHVMSTLTLHINSYGILNENFALYTLKGFIRIQSPDNSQDVDKPYCLNTAIGSGLPTNEDCWDGE